MKKLIVNSILLQVFLWSLVGILDMAGKELPIIYLAGAIVSLFSIMFIYSVTDESIKFYSTYDDLLEEVERVRRNRMRQEKELERIKKLKVRELYNSSGLKKNQNG